MDESMECNRFSFDAFASSGQKTGHAELIKTMRQLSLQGSSLNPDSISNFSDSAFSEPRLFSFFFRNAEYQPTLMQLLIGRANIQSMELVVHSDHCGRIVLPGLGYLKTELPNAELDLSCEPQRKSFSLKYNKQPIAHEFRESLLLPHTNIEIVRFIDPVISHFVSEVIEGSPQLALVSHPDNYLADISAALKLIQDIYPAFYEMLINCVQAIVLFDHPHLNSFAALGMHGMIFLNLRWPASPSFFLDGFLHQGGHVIFNEATLNRQDFFNVDPDTKLSIFSGQDDDRSVYEIFHGLYTEYVLTYVMKSVHNLEIYGRLSFIARAFKADLQSLSAYKKEIFTEVGLKCYETFQNSYAHLMGERDDLFIADLSGQQDEFDISEFKKKNSDLVRLS